MELIFSFLERVGVPAGFAYVLLFRIEPALKELTAAVLKLPQSLHTLNCNPTSTHHDPQPES